MNRETAPTDDIGKRVAQSFETAAELISDPASHEWVCDLEELVGVYEERLSRTGYLDACHILASLYLFTGRPKDALPLFEHCVKENPDFIEARANLAFTMYELGLLPQAQAVFPRLLKSRPANARLHCLYGILFAMQGEYDEAIVEYRRALELTPDNDLVHHYMALARLAVDDETVAVEHIHRAPSLLPFYQSVGILRGNEIDPDLMERYRSLTEGNPLRARCLYEGANHYAAMGEEERAARVLGEAIAIEPDFERYYTALGFIEMNLDRREAAVECLKLALAVDPDAFEPHVHLGFLFGEEGKMDLVMRHFQMAVKARPYYPKLHFNLGEAYLAMDELEEAIKCFRRALKVHPFYVMAMFKLGYVYQEAGRDEEAVKGFSRLKSMDPRFPDVDEFLEQAAAALRSVQVRRNEQI
jgi:tetratricopeptide (TPR) repeat protein